MYIINDYTLIFKYLAIKIIIIIKKDIDYISINKLSFNLYFKYFKINFNKIIKNLYNIFN